MDCAIDWTNSVTAWMSVDETKLKKQMLRLAKEYPDDVVIKTYPECNDGNLVAMFPRSWVKVKPQRKVRLTDEQKKKVADRLAKGRRLASSKTIAKQ